MPTHHAKSYRRHNNINIAFLPVALHPGALARLLPRMVRLAVNPVIEQLRHQGIAGGSVGSIDK